MEILRRALSVVIGGALSLAKGHDPMWTLVPASVAVGLAMLWVFARTSNQQAIRKVKGRLFAHLYEMRLFTDEPALIFKAQWGLLTANVRYIGMMLLPAVVMTIPMILLFAQFECFYGYRPLQPGQDAILTVQLNGNYQGPAPSLGLPDGVVAESPAVRAESQGQISWRIRALHPITGLIRVMFPGETIVKTLEAGPGPRYVSERRVSSAMDLVWHPGESRLNSQRVNWVELKYPEASVRAFGLDLHWLIWLLGFSMVTALVFKRSLGVTF